jgi:outer membrane immunogenic protein
MRHLKFTGSAIIAATVVIGVGAASAADLRPRYAKAPVMAEPVWDWSGFYIGGNVGYGLTHSPTDTAFVNPTVPPSVNVGNPTPISAGGVIGGGQIGYNLMMSCFLLGIEADFQGSDQKGRSFTDLSGFYGPGAFMAVDSRLDWFGTVRGRLGAAVNPATIVYVTGGFAYGQVELANSSNIGNGFAVGSGFVRNTNTGYTAGGGVETRLWNSNWTTKAEYLYVDLGSLALANPNNNGQIHSTTVAFHDNIVRVGLNYKFDWAHPVIARY